VGLAAGLFSSLKITRLAEVRIMSLKSSTRRGFTLVELLVVIAIIALLIAILLPMLNKAKLNAQRTVCLSGQRQLVIAWRLYVDDNKGYMPYGNTDASFGSAPYIPWFRGRDFGNTERAIKDGSIYKYMKSIKVYKCPGDLGERLVSYGVNNFLNGQSNSTGWGSTVEKMSKVRHHTKTYVLIDEYDKRPDNFNRGSFIVQPKGTSPAMWVDYPGMHHGYASAVSFLDGHAEVLVWDLHETKYILGPNTAVTNNKDLLKIQLLRGGPEVD
jgi:prepilin-type N-terminal cleavage/methylation domain-containing protein